MLPARFNGWSLWLACLRWQVTVLGDAATWIQGAGVDLGYLGSDNRPDIRTWRSKSTTARLACIEASLVRGCVGQLATPLSWWVPNFGMQTGIDVDGQVTAAPSLANDAISNANELSHLSGTKVSCLFRAGHGLLLTGGLLKSDPSGQRGRA